MDDSQQQVRRRGMGRRILRLVLLLLVLPVFLLWSVMTSPSLRKSNPSVLAVDASRLRAHVETLAGDYAPRTFADYRNLELCVDYIAGEFRKAGGRVTLQEFEVGDQTYVNPRAGFGPEGGPRIIVGAHYDSCGMTPGADDNASGVAGLLELGHQLAGMDLGCEVELVAYCLEEPPFYETPDMGSARHARLVRQEGVDVRAMLCLEMIGYFSDEPNSQQFPVRLMKLFYPSRANFIAVVGTLRDRWLVSSVKVSMKGATDLPVYSLSGPRFIPGISLSDHRSYWDEGYHAVMITDTSFFRYGEYHLLGDTPDKLDYDRMAKVVIGVAEAVRNLSCRP